MASPHQSSSTRLRLFLQRSASVLWLVAAATYLSVMAGRAIYRNYQSQQETIALEKQLVQASLERERLQALLVYYQTDSYQERELRRALLLKRPGEKVYALPEASHPTLIEDIKLDDTKRATESKPTSEVPIWRQWVEYLRYGQAES